MLTKEEAYKKVAELVERFEEQAASYKKSEYNETQTRRDFIDPFFKALGWDMDNSNGYAEAYREVIHEDKIKIAGATKAPDYSFKLPGGKRLFFVEAKKPSVLVKNEVLPAYQVRRYAWSAKMPISILTDFEEFAIYDCNKKPSPSDKASVARIKYLTYKDYLNEFDFLWETFSKEKVLKGSFDTFIAADKNKKGTATVDKEFLASLDEWRKQLALNIALRNEKLTEDELNFTVQQTLDRIIFLRIAEDRGVEGYENLKRLVKEGDYYSNLYKYFKEADEKYNSGLFDFRKDKISKGITIDNKTIKTIINELYYPVSPYEFSVLSVEILGSAYEQFLGKQIKLTASHRAVIEEKPEVRKAGGVYYTPQYIVEYIVENTVGKLCTGKTPDEVAKLKIVDPACGSGSFLIGAYQYLLSWHMQYYKPDFEKYTAIAQNSKDYNEKQRKEAIKQRNKLPLTPDGNLATYLKKQVLLNNIYGVDIDTQAVEVTKLSLLLKCMEGETGSSITAEMRFGERVLPTLDSNIKCGNSLVDTDFYDGQLDFDPDSEKKIKPFSWQQAFPEVFKKKKAAVFNELKWQAENVKDQADKADELIKKYQSKVEEPKVLYGNKSGFDIVIGNPPYVRQELISEYKDYFQRTYKVYHGMADLYSYFFERGIGLLNDKGLFGIIVANKWMRANYGEPLRKWLKDQPIEQIIDFGDLPVFQGATTYPCIFIVGKEKRKVIEVTNVKTLQFSSLTEYVLENRTKVDQNSLEDSGWNLGTEIEQQLLKKLQNTGIPLGEYVKGKIYYGIKTGLNEAFVIDEATKNNLIKEDKKNKEVIKPFLGGRDIKRYLPLTSKSYLILFPKGFTNTKGNNPKSAWKWLEENYTAIAAYLKPFEEKGKKRSDMGDFWWELRACDYYNEFDKPKLMLPDIALRMQANYDTSGFYCVNTAYIIPKDDKYLLAILNSQLIQFLYSKVSSAIRGGYLRFIRQYLEILPIINSPKQTLYNEIVKLIDTILQLQKEKQTATLPQQVEQLEQRIKHTDDSINKKVYTLYELTPEEIKIVENGNK